MNEDDMAAFDAAEQDRILASETVGARFLELAREVLPLLEEELDQGLRSGAIQAGLSVLAAIAPGGPLLARVIMLGGTGLVIALHHVIGENQ